MDEKPTVVNKEEQDAFSKEVNSKAQRKLKARRHSKDGVWFGLGMMGLIGWSVVIPTLLGAGLGIWLDKHYSENHSWTLALLVAGLILGCLNAWRWVSKENKEIQDEEQDDDTDD